jgi:hypothetical protein
VKPPSVLHLNGEVARREDMFHSKLERYRRSPQPLFGSFKSLGQTPTVWNNLDESLTPAGRSWRWHRSDRCLVCISNLVRGAWSELGLQVIVSN